MDQATSHGVIDAVAPVGAVAAVLNIIATLHPIVTLVSVAYMVVYMYDRYVFHRDRKRQAARKE